MMNTPSTKKINAKFSTTMTQFEVDKKQSNKAQAFTKTEVVPLEKASAAHPLVPPTEFPSCRNVLLLIIPFALGMAFGYAIYKGGVYEPGGIRDQVLCCCVSCCPHLLQDTCFCSPVYHDENDYA